MIPEIDDAVLTRAIATARMVNAGRDYWRLGKVGRLEYADDGTAARGTMVSGQVTGTSRSPYEVELRFRPEASVATTCTCPVGQGCKHSAAVLFALRAQQKLECQNGRVSSLLDAPVAIKPALKVPAAVLPLPPALAQWATTMEPLAKRHAAGARPASRAIVYIVRAQAPSGAARMSKKRPVASLADPGCGVRLFVEAVEVGLDENGNAIGSGSKVVSIGLYPGQAGPAHIDEEDRLITRRLQLRVGDTDHENCLAGLGGSDLFERILRTGRAR